MSAMSEDTFDLDNIHKQLQETESYIKNQSDTVFRRSVTSLRGSSEAPAKVTSSISSLPDNLEARSSLHIGGRGLGDSIPVFRSEAGEYKSLETPLPTRADVGDSPPMGKYADSAKREELIQKLLIDYNERKRTPRSYLDLPEEVGKLDVAMAVGKEGYGGVKPQKRDVGSFEVASPYAESLLFGDPSPQSTPSERDGEVAQPTLYFASDLTNTSKEDDRLSLDRGPTISSGIGYLDTQDDMLATLKFVQSLKGWDSREGGGDVAAHDNQGTKQEKEEGGKEEKEISVMEDDSIVQPTPNPTPSFHVKIQHKKPTSHQEVRRSTSRERLLKEAEERFRALHPFHPTMHSSPHASAHAQTRSRYLQPTHTHTQRYLQSAHTRSNSPAYRSQRYANAGHTSDNENTLDNTRSHVDSTNPTDASHRQRLATTSDRENSDVDRTHAKKSKSNRLDMLYREHFEKQRRHLAMRREMQEVEEIGCTFTPRINERSEGLARGRRGRDRSVGRSRGASEPPPSPSRRSLSKEDDVGHRLHSYASQQVAYKQQLSEAYRERSLTPYTFTPNIPPTHKGKYLGKVGAQPPLWERWGQVWREQVKEREEVRERVQKEREEKMTFTPRINSSFHNRSNRNTSTDQPYLSHQENDTTPEEDLCFNFNVGSGIGGIGGKVGVGNGVKVRDSSVYGYGYRVRDQDVGERLYRESESRRRRFGERLGEREREVGEQSTPPVVSKGTKKIAKKSGFVRANFLTRQQMHMQRVQQTEQALARQREDEQDKWFTPQLYPYKKEKGSSDEEEGDRVEYLYKGDIVEREKRKHQLEKDLYGVERGYTYHPHLDPLSLKLGRPSSVGDLYRGVGSGMSRGGKDQVKKEVEEEIGVECTFTPHITPHSRRILERGRNPSVGRSKGYDEVYRQYHAQTLGGYASSSPSPSPTPHPTPCIINLQEPEKMMENIHTYLSKHEEKRQRGEVEKELKELGGCTFHPRLVAKFDRGDMDRPVVVPGLARHLELVAMRAKRQEEKRQREKEAFSVPHVEKMRREEDGSTIVESFHFHLDGRRFVRLEESSAGRR